MYRNVNYTLHIHILKVVKKEEILYFPGSPKCIFHSVFNLMYYVRYFNENESDVNLLFSTRVSQSLPVYHT